MKKLGKLDPRKIGLLFSAIVYLVFGLVLLYPDLGIDQILTNNQLLGLVFLLIALIGVLIINEKP